MRTSIFIVTGYNTNPSGECLGMRRYAESLAQLWPNLKIFSIGWDQLYPQYWDDKHPNYEEGDIRINLSHSYGGASSKRNMDSSLPHMNLSVWFDPVPRFWWGQLRFGKRWNFPIGSDRNIQFIQRTDPLLSGYAFQSFLFRDVTLDVTKLGLHHGDVPGNSEVLTVLTTKIIEQFELTKRVEELTL